MTDSFSHAGQRQLIADLAALIARRAKAEEDLVTRYDAACRQNDAEFRTGRERIENEHRGNRTQTEADYDAARRAALAEFTAADAALRRDHEAATRATIERIDEHAAKARAKHKEARWEAATLYDTTKNQPRQRLAAVKKQIDEVQRQLAQTDEQARRILAARRQRIEAADPPSADEAGRVPAHPPDGTVLAAPALARDALKEIDQQKSSRWCAGAAPAGVFFLALVLFVVPSGFIFGWSNPLWAVVSLVLAVAASVGVYMRLRPHARREAAARYAALRQIAADALAAAQRWIADATAQCEREQAESLARRDAAVASADAALQTALASLTAERQTFLQAAQADMEPRLAAVATRRDELLAAADAKYPALLAKLDSCYRSDLEANTARHEAAVAENERQRSERYDELVAFWRAGIERFQRGVAGQDRRARELFLDWTAGDLAAWKPPTVVPPGIRFGQIELNLAQIRGGIPADEALRPAQTRFALPALLPFPQRGSLVVKSSGEARAEANALLQAIMLRLLTSLPPGKVRFTIVDAVGLGENFSAFMHLADFEEALVTSRIWTEPAQVEHRLADLTEHMENVIQKYLRNEYETLEDYNRRAGEVAEPYRFLVVANFPAGFNENSLRRLAAIANAGPRCGVFTLIAVDTKQPLPVNFNLADIEQNATVLRWQDGRFRWNHADFERLPLELDKPAAPDRFTEIVRRAGQAAKDSKRVEVPFDVVAPAADAWWTESTAAGVNVPLGRAGATKLQEMRLGKGTSQHALIAGKTGSGKSTLLHALVTNAALRFSPEEIEFYLIDFKKGVEFKVYATHALPHARVIAIESEREFGLSVLERLDAELKRRGELFRDAGVQDLPGFRAARPDEPLPRTLLVVDEFQELFVEDDKLAQDAALLLDRLVRQGRAFGIHVVLGSQTLGGAYSLARTTLGQMAVRVALQCSEADAHLILSEENTAARLLSRPGEAIYNDANGLVEGNHPFQVVWLGDDRREDYLRKLKELAERREIVTRPPIVFEGNMAADLATNGQLRHWIAADHWPARATGSASAPPVAWLGAAVAIKDPTSATLRRQSGANVLVVGQQPQAALGVLASSIISLVAQHAPNTNGAADSTGSANESGGTDSASGARFYILDGIPPDSPDSGALAKLAAALPHQIAVTAPRDLAATIAKIDQIVTDREKDRPEDAPPVYLFIADLGRLRDLRKADDDFGFSSFGAEPKAANSAKLFAHILREGPAVGVHSIVWCDTYNNVTRSLDRHALKDFEIRVLFAMTGVDSSNLIDSPAAGKLGPHRALFYTEEQGRTEKFRPYGWPSAEFLAWVKRLFAKRTATAEIEV